MIEVEEEVDVFAAEHKKVPLSGLPDHWEVKELGPFIKKIEAGKSLKCDERPPREGEIGIIKVSAVTWGEFTEEESKTILSEEHFKEEYLIKEGDFLFSRANTLELVGACVIVKSFNKKLMLSDKILRFKLSPDLLKTYLLYYLRSKAGRREIELLASGNQESMRNIGQQKIRQIKLPVPPLSEQQTIVAKIEELFSALDKGKQQLEEVRQQLKVYRQAVLKWAFEGKLTNGSVCEGKLPEGWEWVKIQDIADKAKHSLKAGPFGSALKKEFYVENGYKIYGQEQVISGDPFFGDYYISEDKFKELSSNKVKPRDILISLVGTVGKVLVLPRNCEEGIINPRLIKVSLDEKLYLPSFFKYYFESSIVKQHYSSKTQGTTMDVLNLGIVKTIPFPLCSLEEQQVVVQEIESRLSVCDKMEETIEQSLLQAETLRQSILKRAFEGRLL